MKKKIQKPFDVETAKNGAKIETKCGDSVRIICYNKEGGQYPIIALVDDGSGYEVSIEYTHDGKLFYREPSEHDLVIVEEVEVSKFNPGDWMFKNTHGEHPLLITAVTSEWYEVQDTQGHKDSIAQITVDNYFRLWTLKDAKPGDVLIDGFGHPFIFKVLNSKDYPIAYCGINVSNSVVIDADRWTYDSVRPAAYEERQQLFNKLKEEGYKWNAETLTLSKVQKRWRDDETQYVEGCFITPDSGIVWCNGLNKKGGYNRFTTVPLAKSALAMARISQIMANDKRFGGPIADDEWDGRHWYSIVRVRNLLLVDAKASYEFLAFHTLKQANLFLEENEDLIKDYYMMD